MQMILWEFLYFISKLKLEDLPSIQSELINFINSIENNQLRRLLVLVADDYLVTKDKNWLKYLLEVFFYKTKTGGEKFYESLNKYMENNDMEMTKLYTLALSFGFKGNNSDYSVKDICQIIHPVTIPDAIRSFFVPGNPISHKRSFFLLLIPPLITLIITNLSYIWLIKQMGGSI